MQVFLFPSKPGNVGLLKRDVHGALNRYMSFKRAPELTREQPVPPPQDVRDSQVGQRILYSARNLRERWFAESR